MKAAKNLAGPYPRSTASDDSGSSRKKQAFMAQVGSASADQQLQMLRPPTPYGYDPATVQMKAASEAPSGASAPVQMAPYAHAAEEPKYQKALEDQGVATAKAKKIAKLVFEGLAAGGDRAKFDLAAAEMPIPTIPANGLAFWSGYGCEDEAKKAGKGILANTELGKLGKFKFSEPDFFTKRPLWCAISARFAKAAKGKVTAYVGFSTYEKIGGINDKSVFATDEKATIELMSSDRSKALSWEYHWIAGIHDIEKGKLGEESTMKGTKDALPPATNESAAPKKDSLYWITGNPAHVGKSFKTNWIEKYKRDDGTEVKGHLRGV